MTKKCNRCQQNKSLKDFSKNKNHKDNLGYYCKTCERKRGIEYKNKLRKKRKLSKFISIPKHIKTYKLKDYKKLYNVCGVYTFIDKDKKVIYIGSSYNIGDRTKKCRYTNKKLLKSWGNKEIIYIGLLEECETPLEAQQKEQYYIKRWPTKLFNTCSNYKIHLSNKDIERFWSKVKKANKDECLEWKCSLDKDRYGYMCIKDIKLRSHRIAYKIANPDVDLMGITIRHKCNNKLCVNPNHLEIGSSQDNTKDRLDVKLLKAFGKTKTYKEWEMDNRCNVNSITIIRRIKSGIPPEEAITNEPYKLTKRYKEKSNEY